MRKELSDTRRHFQQIARKLFFKIKLIYALSTLTIKEDVLNNLEQVNALTRQAQGETTLGRDVW